MFHTYKCRVAVGLLLCGLAAQPLASIADEAPPPETQAQTSSSEYSPAAVSFDVLRQDTKTKISETRMWVDAQTATRDLGGVVKDMERRVDRFQDSVTPAGRSMKNWVKNKMSWTGLVTRGDKTFSVYGLMLMMAFALVFLLMSLSQPMSRLGGRH
jgi:hypothetical protein